MYVAVTGVNVKTSPLTDALTAVFSVLLLTAVKLTAVAVTVGTATVPLEDTLPLEELTLLIAEKVFDEASPSALAILVFLL